MRAAVFIAVKYARRVFSASIRLSIESLAILANLPSIACWLIIAAHFSASTRVERHHQWRPADNAPVAAPRDIAFSISAGR